MFSRKPHFLDSWKITSTLKLLALNTMIQTDNIDLARVAARLCSQKCHFKSIQEVFHCGFLRINHSLNKAAQYPGATCGSY